MKKLAKALAVVISLSVASVAAAKRHEWREGMVTKITSEAPGATPAAAETVFRYRIQRTYYWITTGNITYVLVNAWSVGFHAPKAPLNVTLNGKVKIAIEGKNAWILDDSGKRIERPIVAKIAEVIAPPTTPAKE
jgi:hypothetical protein